MMLVQNSWPDPFVAIVLEDFGLGFFQAVPSLTLRVIEFFPSSEKATRSMVNVAGSVSRPAAKLCGLSAGRG